MVLVTFLWFLGPKGWAYFGAGGHGAPWAPKSVFGPESCISRPPKVTPRRDNRLKKEAKVVEKLFPNLDRRTARSGLDSLGRISFWTLGHSTSFRNQMAVHKCRLDMGVFTLIWARLELAKWIWFWKLEVLEKQVISLLEFNKKLRLWISDLGKALTHQITLRSHSYYCLTSMRS